MPALSRIPRSTGKTERSGYSNDRYRSGRLDNRSGSAFCKNTITSKMCHSVLKLCPGCKSNIRHLEPCSSGTTISDKFKYTTLTAEVCAATGSLLSVAFDYGDCDDCIRYAKAEALAKANVHVWQNELNILADRAKHYTRRTALQSNLAGRPDARKSVDDQGGRKALLKLWYEEAKNRSLRTLHAASGSDSGHEQNLPQSPKSPKSPKVPKSPRVMHSSGLHVHDG